MRFEIDRCRALYALGRPRHRLAAAGVGPLRRHRPACSTPGSSTEIEAADYDVFTRPGPGADLAQGSPSAARMRRNAAPVSSSDRRARRRAGARWPALTGLDCGVSPLPPRTRRLPRAGATVSVVVPARDEAATLPACCVPRRLSQPAPRRGDRGRRRVHRRHRRSRRRARRDGRRPRHAPPAGWLGKPWACARRRRTRPAAPPARVPRRRHRLGPDALGRRCSPRTARRTGLLSVQPHHRTVRADEQLSAFCNVVPMMGSGAFGLRRPLDPTVAFGPCLVSPAGATRRPAGTPRCAARWSRTSTSPAPIAAAGLAGARASAAARWCASACTPAGFRQLVEGWTQEPRRRAPRRGAAAAVAGAVLWVAACAAVGAGRRRRRLAAGLAGGRCPAALRWCAGCSWRSQRPRGSCGRIGSFRWWTACCLPGAAGGVPRRSSPARWPLVLRRPAPWRGRRVDVGAASEPAVPVRLSTAGRSRSASTSAAWAVVHSVTGYAVHRLPRAPACDDGRLYPRASVETRAALYRARLGVRRWKDRAARGRRAVRRRASQAHACRRADRRARSASPSRPAGPSSVTGSPRPAARCSRCGTRRSPWRVMVVYGVAVNAAVHRHPALQPAARRPGARTRPTGRRRRGPRRPRRADEPRHERQRASRRARRRRRWCTRWASRSQSR